MAMGGPSSRSNSRGMTQLRMVLDQHRRRVEEQGGWRSRRYGALERFDVNIRMIGLQLQDQIEEIGDRRKICREPIRARLFMPVRMHGEPDVHPMLPGQCPQGQE